MAFTAWVGAAPTGADALGVGRTPHIAPQLTKKPFSLDDARRAGLTKSSLRGKSWHRLGAELYCWGGRPADPWMVLSAWQRHLPSGAVFAGKTAAWLFGLDLEPLNPSAENHMDPTPFFDSMESISDLNEQEITLCEKSISKRRLHPLDPNYSDTSSAAWSNILATPSVRHFSRQKGVDLAKLAPGSGKDGRIEKKDVEAYLAKATAGSIAGWEVQGEKDVVVELGRTRYGMWKAMVKVYMIPFDDNHPILI